jgi:hypothetical protein
LTVDRSDPRWLRVRDSIRLTSDGLDADAQADLVVSMIRKTSAGQEADVRGSLADELRASARVTGVRS